MIRQDDKELLAERLVTTNLHKIRKLVAGLEPVELAEVLHYSKDINASLVFQVLTPEMAIKTFEHLDFDIQNELLDSFTSEQLGNTLNKLSPDDRTAFFEQLSDDTLQKYLSLLTDEERKTAKQLLQYPEDSIGRLMTPDFVSVKEDWTVEQSLEYIRRHGNDSE